MSAHVVVIDATARRATVKTTPGKHLTDVLQEACTKLGYNSSQYGLKHNRKQIDLSLSFRLSGLSSGAKLELVQLSRSPSVVTVALQLPESEARGAPNGRILDKFPSTTTLWLVLRKFEAGVAGAGPIRNLTARGVPSTTRQTGAGRLFYEIPVLQILERELSSFTDLQKTLAQLGFNSGNVLIRLNFRRTEDPLEEAMTKIGEYFKSSEDEMPAPAQIQPPTAPVAEGTVPSEDQSAHPTGTEPDNGSKLPVGSGQDASLSNASPEQPMSITTSDRNVTVFSPPSDNTPSSAQIPYNEEDYIPSVEHAKAHQRLLNKSSHNTRLPTDAEIAAKAAAEEKRRLQIHEVDMKVRFPDQSQVVAKFGPTDSGKSLYGFVRSCLAPEFSEEKFTLNVFLNPAAPRASHANTISDSEQILLIKDLGLAGRVLVNFSWFDASAHQGRVNLLRPELRSQAQQLKVEQPSAAVEDSSALSSAAAGPSTTSEGSKPNGARKSGGMPKWLKLPGKK
ncbi:hypothetical protein N7462_009268 [Penicillium macrosclerotiorum]|uniref:uncharacterized protein n=1 Tax=Penicillium macrosclerotiorum TaxID=303699 RepID=UPI002546DDA1|nr:uncharacterized protein N7462_009268 [Penicillium macrosclerotiorum]KAJ5673829.1 hypothetical protein N7462_009268 [Penicillium macrosclerotiorum]